MVIRVMHKTEKGMQEQGWLLGSEVQRQSWMQGDRVASLGGKVHRRIKFEERY